MSKRLSTREVATMLGVDLWRVQRLFEDGHLPEPERFCGRRVIGGEMLPAVIDALRERNWLSQSDAERSFNCSRCGQPENHEHAGQPYCELCRGCDRP